MKKIIKLFSLYRTIVFILLLAFTESHAEHSIETITEHFHQLDNEVFYGHTVPESLLRCSYLQDAWVAYLHEAGNCTEFVKGMSEINKITRNFKSMMSYVSNPDVINFFHPGQPQTLYAQTTEVSSKNESTLAFLNTFKTGHDLNESERERLFNEEWTQYEKEYITKPFDLNKQRLPRLESGKLYNFVLLPNGTIKIALEKPGGKDYQLIAELGVGKFAYPNHTILAGSPHQPVLTAGALLPFRDNDKALFFISPKSGHYVPTFHSLAHIVKRLSELGIEEDCVIPVPTVDLGGIVLKTYNTAQIPLFVDDQDIKRLFNSAKLRWHETVENIDLEFLQTLAEGNYKPLMRNRMQELTNQREEATFMRSAFHLFSYDHEAPSLFHKFVKRFGKLKDAIKHGVNKKIIKQANWLLNFLNKNDISLKNLNIELSKEDDFFNFLVSEIKETHEFLRKNELTIDEFHDIKKKAREISTLFMYLSDEHEIKGKYYFIYRAAYMQLFRINEMMAEIHDEQIGKILREEIDKNDITLSVSEKTEKNLSRLFNQLGISPQTFSLSIDQETGFWMINSAKEWYSAHSWISCNEGHTNPQNYTPIPLKTLTKISKEETIDFDIYYQETLSILKHLLRKTHVAQNALIFLDIKHAAPQVIIDYMNCLKKIISSMENNEPHQAKQSAILLLDYMKNRNPPTNALENWECSDQESFEYIFWDHISSLEILKKDYVTKGELCITKDKVQAIADLMTLYLQNGQKYQTLPSCAYEVILKKCHRLITAITVSINNTPNNSYIQPSTEMIEYTEYLIKKFAYKTKFQNLG